MHAEPDFVAETALDWVIRTDRDDFADWEQLTAWLGADPRHAEAYAHLQIRSSEAATAAANMALTTPASANTIITAAVGRWQLPRLILPLAASLVLMLGVATAWFWHAGTSSVSGVGTVAFAAQPGEVRAVTLADGTKVDMAGGTRLLVADGGRNATLERGRATFAVVHDSARPFSVRVSDETVTDVGTLFDIRTRDDGFDLAVGEGMVRVTGEGTPLTVVAGQGIRVRGTSISRVPSGTSAVGGWLTGRYSYTDATIGEVADDLSSATGAYVSAAPDVAGKHFAGTLSFGKDAATTVKSIAPALGLVARRHGESWVLESVDDASSS